MTRAFVVIENPALNQGEYIYKAKLFRSSKTRRPICSLGNSGSLCYKVVLSFSLILETSLPSELDRSCF